MHRNTLNREGFDSSLLPSCFVTVLCGGLHVMHASSASCGEDGNATGSSRFTYPRDFSMASQRHDPAPSPHLHCATLIASLSPARVFVPIAHPFGYMHPSPINYRFLSRTFLCSQPPASTSSLPNTASTTPLAPTPLSTAPRLRSSASISTAPS